MLYFDVTHVLFFQYLRYVFHLYLADKVESVKIVAEQPMLSGDVTLNLISQVSEDGKYWKSPQQLLHPDHQESFRYRYLVKYKEGLPARIFNALTFSKDEKAVQETKSRKLNSGINQFDIFHNPNEKYDNWKKSIFLGHLFFVKLLYRRLSQGHDLKEMLMECELVGFGHPSYTEENVKSFMQWVVQIIDRDRSPRQSVYICSLLGQFVRGVRGLAWKTCDLLGQKAADQLLLSMGCCNYEALPKSSVTFINTVAEELFKAGSERGCLMFIKVFCNLLHVNDVKQVADKLSSSSYTEMQFDKQVPRVLESLTRLKDLDTRRIYSCYIIRCSPSVQCLWNLYHEISHQPNLFQNLVDDFSSVYCKFISRRGATKPDLLQPCFWSQVPKNLKEKLANPFCKALTEQISSGTNWSHSSLNGLTDIVQDACLQSEDQFYRLVLAIMTHKSEEMVSIIPVLLESTAFCTYWNNRISKADKKKVCVHWLKANCYRDGKKQKEQILDVVEACESLHSTKALKMDNTLCQDMDKEVQLMVLRSKFESITDAWKDAQSRAPAIQQRLTMLLRSAIQQQSGTGDRRSRIKKMVHLLGYNVSKERKKELRKERLDG